MLLIYEAAVDKDGPPFRTSALRQRVVLEKLAGTFHNRLLEHHRDYFIPGVPVGTTVQALVDHAVNGFKAPPLLASLPDDSPVQLLCFQNNGQYYNSWGLPRNRRWQTVPLQDFASKSLLEIFLRKGTPLNAKGIAEGPGGLFILNIRMLTFFFSCKLCFC